MTLAFSIKYPWRNKYGHRDRFIDIWHIDPETDGSDDSCGWFKPKLNKEEREYIERHIKIELDNKYSDFFEFNRPITFGSHIFLIINAFNSFKWKECRQRLNGQEINHIISNYSNLIDNLIPAFQINKKEDDIKTSLFTLYRNYKQMRRKWWQHPRWHFKHWKIICRPLQNFKRWAFSKCCKCNKGFKWGYSPCSNSWDSEWPRWFASEKNIYHHDCGNPKDDNAAKAWSR